MSQCYLKLCQLSVLNICYHAGRREVMISKIAPDTVSLSPAESRHSLGIKFSKNLRIRINFQSVRTVGD